MPKIMQHCFGANGSGGPVVAFDRLITNSSLPYGQIRQDSPAGGLSLALIRRFISEIREYEPDLIHVRGLGNEGFHATIAARLAGVPNILISIHGTHRDLKQPDNQLKHRIVTKILEPLTLMMSTHIATVCEFAANRDFLNSYRHKLVGTVPNGVYIPAEIYRGNKELRIKWCIPEGWPIAICVSRITSEKGYLVLAEALKLLDDNKTQNFAVMIIGGGDDDGKIKARFAKLKNIKVCFTGHQKDVASFLTEGDFFLFPSLHENLSNALIEAMSYGLPVIATSVGGNTEVVSKGGGVLVPANNSDALSAAIKRFLHDPVMLKKLSSEARSNIERNYSIQRMVSGWERTYLKILEGSHGKA